MVRNARISWLVDHFNAKNVISAPITNEPVILTTTVPQGKPEPSNRPVHTLTKYRPAAPKAPPAATHSIIGMAPVYPWHRMQAIHNRIGRHGAA